MTCVIFCSDRQPKTIQQARWALAKERYIQDAREARLGTWVKPSDRPTPYASTAANLLHVHQRTSDLHKCGQYRHHVQSIPTLSSPSSATQFYTLYNQRAYREPIKAHVGVGEGNPSSAFSFRKASALSRDSARKALGPKGPRLELKRQTWDTNLTPNNR